MLPMEGYCHPIYSFAPREKTFMPSLPYSAFVHQAQSLEPHFINHGKVNLGLINILSLLVQRLLVKEGTVLSFSETRKSHCINYNTFQFGYQVHFCILSADLRDNSHCLDMKENF